MFAFLLSEGFWMEAIISSLITGVVTIIGAIIVYQVKITKIHDQTKGLSKEHLNLSGEHTDLSREHSDLSTEHHDLASKSDAILKDTAEISQNVTGIEKRLIEEHTKQEFRYQNLTDKQKDIMASVENIQAIAGEMARLQNENMLLREKLRQAAQNRPNRPYAADPNYEDDFDREPERS